MEQRDWTELIARGEGQGLEFKREWAKDVDEKLVSFANARGGILLFGVDDKTRAIVGVPEVEWARLEASVIAACDACRPPLRLVVAAVNVSSVRLLAVRVERSLDVHSTSDGRIWLRVGSTARVATPDEITRLLQDRGKLATDEFPVEGARYEDLREEKLARYIERRASSTAPRLADGRPLPVVAASLGLLRQQGETFIPTVAGILFFGVYPQQFIDYSTVRALRFQGNDVAGRVLLDRAMLEGTLDEIIDAAVAFVGRNMKVTRLVGVVTQEVPEYSLDAVREAIANAVIHRDYTDRGREVLVRMFDQRLEIASPGGLAGPITRETLGAQYFARNRRLAAIAFELGRAERAGTGIPRMLYESARLGALPPEFVVTEDTFTVKFWSRHRDLEKVIAEGRGEYQIG